VLLQGSQKLPWHNLQIRPSHVQQMPGMFRVYPHEYGRVRKLAFKLYKKVWNALGTRDAA